MYCDKGLFFCHSGSLSFKDNTLKEEKEMSFLWEGIAAVTWQQLVMYVVGAALIWIAIKKEYEPSLLLPMGFGAILVNLPAVTPSIRLCRA